MGRHFHGHHVKAGYEDHASSGDFSPRVMSTGAWSCLLTFISSRGQECGPLSSYSLRSVVLKYSGMMSVFVSVLPETVACGYNVYKYIISGAESFLSSWLSLSESVYFTSFKEPEGSVPCSQEPATESRPEADESKDPSSSETLCNCLVRAEHAWLKSLHPRLQAWRPPLFVSLPPPL
jgi:hypothetical protein